MYTLVYAVVYGFDPPGTRTGTGLSHKLISHANAERMYGFVALIVTRKAIRARALNVNMVHGYGQLHNTV